MKVYLAQQLIREKIPMFQGKRQQGEGEGSDA
jgi:hypothetical protein